MIWTGVTDAWLTDSLTTLKDSANQLLIKYKSGALVTQLGEVVTIADVDSVKCVEEGFGSDLEAEVWS